MDKKTRSEISELTLSPTWRKLPFEDRRFLSRYAYVRDWKRAQIEAKVSNEWLAEREQDPDFVAIVQMVLDQPVQVGATMMAEAVPQAVIELFTVMEQNKNLNAKLKAIEIIFKSTGVLMNDEEGGDDNRSWSFTVNHWNKTVEPNGRVLEHAAS